MVSFLKTRVITTRKGNEIEIEIENQLRTAAPADLRAHPCGRKRHHVTTYSLSVSHWHPNQFSQICISYSLTCTLFGRSLRQMPYTPALYLLFASAHCNPPLPSLSSRPTCQAQHGSKCIVHCATVHRSAPRVCILPDVDGQCSTTSCSCMCRT